VKSLRAVAVVAVAFLAGYRIGYDSRETEVAVRTVGARFAGEIEGRVAGANAAAARSAVPEPRPETARLGDLLLALAFLAMAVVFVITHLRGV